MWQYTRLSPLLALNPSLQVPRLSLPPPPPPDCSTQQLTFHAVALEFIFSWSRRKTGFSSLGTAKRGEVPLSDLMAFLSAPQAPVQVTSCALSRRSAPADPGSQATNPKILFPPRMIALTLCKLLHGMSVCFPWRDYGSKARGLP